LSIIYNFNIDITNIFNDFFEEVDNAPCPREAVIKAVLSKEEITCYFPFHGDKQKYF
jgi:hypothetical protein